MAHKLLSEAFCGLYAVLRVARLDREAVRHIAASPAAAMRSFIVLLWLLPLWVLQILWTGVALSPQSSVLGLITLLALVVLSRVISVLFFYSVAGRLAEQMGIKAHFPLFVAAQNWAAVPATLVVVAFTALWQHMGYLPEHTVWLISGLQSLTIVYSWLITVSTLPVGAVAGFGFCALEILSAVLVQKVIEIVIRLTLYGGAG